MSPAAPVLAAMMAAATVAHAADKPVVGPPAAWVSPPGPSPQVGKAAAGAAVAVLLEDVQLRFDAQGWSQFTEYQAKAQTAQGLAALGTLSISWAPATDAVTVHRLRILRGDTVIDLLPKDGAFTILRRETQLESAAMLTGVLTAVVQPEGLQVGDIVDLAMTTRREDPLFKGRIDGALGGLDGAPLSRLRLRALWPRGAAVRWRALDGMPEPKLGERDGFVEALIEADDLTPLVKPEGAPARFRRGREFDVSNYATWADASAVLAPLFAQAERLKPGSQVAAQAAAIAARTQDPAARASAALALVQEQVRYVAQAMGAAGYTPATADQTWERRFGDCKGKTVLLIALLKALGIEAEPALVSSTQGDGLDARLPAISPFDHVLVRAHVGGRDYWLDGTRTGDRDLASISTPAFGFVLPLRETGATLVRLQPEPAKRPLAALAVRIDATRGIDKPAPFHVDATFRGDAGLGLKLSLANLTPDDLDRALRAYWRSAYDSVEVSKVSAAYDAPSGEERLSMDGSATMDWSNGGYEADGASLGWRFDAHRDPGPHADAPFAVAFPGYELKTETILLPGAGKGFSVWGQDVDKELAGYAFHRKAVIEGGAFRIEASSRALKPEITLAQAKADAPAVTELGKGTVRVRSVQQTAQVQADHKTLLTTQPTTRDGYIERGSAFLDDGRFAEALKDFDKAVGLDAGSAEAIACRGLARAWLGQAVAAKADLDRAEALDPAQVVVWRARGMLAQQAGDQAAAVSAYTRALELMPGDAFSLQRRAGVYVRLKDYPRALADLDAEVKASGDTPALHAAKAEVYGWMGDLPRLRSESALAQVPGQTKEDAGIDLLDRLWRTGHKGEARAEVERMISAGPTPELYLRRSAFRDAADLAGKEADARAALALDPKSYAAAATIANIRFKANDLAAARTYAEQAAADAPDEAYAQLAIAPVVAKAGGKEASARTLARTRVLIADDAVALNSLCYGLAVAAVELEGALADCDRSLKLKPGVGAVLDSRAFVLLRLGRDTEALGAYDAALSAQPTSADSLYGRSLVERRLGKAEASDRDRNAALAQNPEVARTFADYGVTR